ncbi:MAG: LysR family transcriptional regulator [Deltaproteobacteria bacterium RIFOXYB12_FULL_58_9]|nr:MAG: LysR family transcriptional regulator [Deltaproteobacteria bacterium RIFOXYB12_FULL_58_9]
MEWLNYHHLLYFWVVAKQGSIVAASKELRLAHPTISGQIHRLEEVLGQKLFSKQGRNLVLTDEGRVVFRYAEEIFGLGRELLETVKGRPTNRLIRVVVGISDTIAKSIVRRILEPVFDLGENIQVICRNDRSVDAFMGDLAQGEVDVVLSDAPAGPGSPVRAFNHLLGECGTTFFAAAPLAARLRRRFPSTLDGIPFLAPGAESVLRRALNQWFDSNDVRPRIVSELDDVALAKIFAESGLGVLAAPSVVETELRQRYRLHVVGRTEKIRHQFFAISLERRIKHPAVAAICEEARKSIFA